MCGWVGGGLTQALSSWLPSSRRTCSAWAGLMLTSEKPDKRSDVASSWARTCKRRNNIASSAYALTNWFLQTLNDNSLHGSAAQNGGVVSTVPAWCGDAPRNRQRPSPSRPADPGVWGGQREIYSGLRGQVPHQFCYATFPLPLYSS